MRICVQPLFSMLLYIIAAFDVKSGDELYGADAKSGYCGIDTVDDKSCCNYLGQIFFHFFTPTILTFH